MFRIKRAIIMAAGFGSRLMPLTQNTPKPLIKVNGVPMIETIIDGLVSNEIMEIHIVVGHLKEQFYQFKEEIVTKYSDIKINIIENPYYDKCNNISSLYVAKNYVSECVVIDGDQVLVNRDILNPNVNMSGYCSSEVFNGTDEWLQQIDEDGIVTECSRVGGEKGYQLHGVSFWSEEDGNKLQELLELEFKQKHNTEIYWDDIAMFVHKDKFCLGIREISSNDIIEIDSIDELKEIDKSYKEDK